MKLLLSVILAVVITGVVGDLYYKHEGSVYGPFSVDQMLDWLNAGYFTPDLLVSPDSYFSQSCSILDYFNSPMASGNRMNNMDIPGNAFNEYHLSEQADDWLDDENAQPTMYQNYLNKIASKIPYSYQQKASDIANKVTDKVSDSFGRVSERASWLANVAAERFSIFRSRGGDDSQQQQSGKEAYQGHLGYDQHGQPIYNNARQAYASYSQQQQGQSYDPYNQQQQGQSYDPYNQQQQGQSYDPYNQQQQGQSYDPYNQQQQGQSYDPYNQQQQEGYPQGQQYDAYNWQQQHIPYHQGEQYDPYNQQQDPYAFEQNDADPDFDHYHPAEAEAPVNTPVPDFVDEAAVLHAETVTDANVLDHSSGSIFGRFPTASRPLGRAETPEQSSADMESIGSSSGGIDVEERPVNVFPMPPQVSLDSSPSITLDTDAPTLDSPSITIAKEVLEEIEQSEMHEHQDYEQQFSPWEHIANSEWKKDQDVTDHLESFYGYTNEMLAAEANKSSPGRSRRQQGDSAMNSMDASSAMQQQSMRGMEQHSFLNTAYPSDDQYLHQPYYDQQQTYESSGMHTDTNVYPVLGEDKEEYDWTSELMSSHPYESPIKKKWKQMLGKIGSGMKKISLPSLPFFGKKEDIEDDWLADLNKDEHVIPIDKGSALMRILQDMLKRQLFGISLSFTSKIIVLLAVYGVMETYMPIASEQAKVYYLFSLAVLSVQYLIICFGGMTSMQHLSSQSNVTSDLYGPAEDNSNILSLLVHLAYLREFLAMSQGKNWAITPHVQQLLSAEQRKALQLLEEHEYQNSYSSGGEIKTDAAVETQTNTRVSVLPHLLWQCVSFGLLSYLMVTTTVLRMRELGDESVWNFQVPVAVLVDENTEGTQMERGAATRKRWFSSAVPFFSSHFGNSQEKETLMKFLSYAMGRVWSTPASSDTQQSLKYILNVLGSAVLVLMPLLLVLSFYRQFYDTRHVQQRLRDIVDASRDENDVESADCLSFRVKISYNGIESLGKVPIDQVKSFL